MSATAVSPFVTVLDDNTGRALTIRTEIRDAATNLLNHATTDRVLALVADGLCLSHDEAEYLGEETVSWIRDRFDLRFSADAYGVNLLKRS
jgi:hypothetical protein